MLRAIPRKSWFIPRSFMRSHVRCGSLAQPPARPQGWEFLAPSLAATSTLAELLAGEAQVGDCICLFGPVGAGKSAFSRAFIRAVADDAALAVPSPTFLLQLTYEDHSGPPVHHYDLYRLAGPDDLRGLDLQDSFTRAVSLLEWAERLGPAAPLQRLDLYAQEAPSAAVDRTTDRTADRAADAAESRTGDRIASRSDDGGADEDDEEGGGTPRRFVLAPHGARWRALAAAVAAFVRDPPAGVDLGGLRVVEGEPQAAAS